MRTYKHILLATDFSPTCAHVGNTAATLAKLFNAKLSLVHTIEPIPAYGYPNFKELESPIIEEAKKQLAKATKKLQIEDKDVHLLFGSVKTEVLDLATQLKVDLIILGSHGRHGIGRLLGSSANSIVHLSKCDVLTVRCEE